MFAFAPFAILFALFAAAGPLFIRFITKPGPGAAQHAQPSASSVLHHATPVGADPHCALCEAAAKEVPADVFPSQAAPIAARNVPQADPLRAELAGYTIDQASSVAAGEAVPHAESQDSHDHINASTERLIQPPPVAANSGAAPATANRPAETRKSWRESWRQVFGVGVAT